jgi:hypothetical protein
MLRFHNMLPALAFITVTGTAFSAYAGPCTAQIAQVEQRTVGAQLGRQPTPRIVRDAEMKANTLAQAALERVKKDDTADNAATCTRALSALKEWYGLQ